jgi:hypothetical protein
LALGGVLLAALLVRAWTLDGGGVRLDEGYSLLQSELGVGRLLHLKHDPNPPLHLLLLKAWRGLFGPSELAAKALSALLGVAGVAATWWAARLRFGDVAAVGASALVALQPWHVDFSREVRGYALLYLGVALADAGFSRWRRSGRGRDLLLWAGGASVALGCHHFAGYFVACYVVAGWLRRPDRRGPLLLAAGLVGLLHLPALASLHAFMTEVQTGGDHPPTVALGDVPGTYLLVAGGRWTVLGGRWGAALVWLVVLLFLRRARRSPRRGELALPLALLAFPLVGFVLTQLVMPVYLNRYFFICLLPLALLFGAALASAPRWRLRAGAALALFLGATFPGYFAAERSDWAFEVERYARTIAEGRGEDDLVLYASKFAFAPAVALHPPEWTELLAPNSPELDADRPGPPRSYVLTHLVAREVWPEPGFDWARFGRVWVLVLHDSERDAIEAAPWFRALAPELEWKDDTGYLLRYRLGEGG